MNNEHSIADTITVPAPAGGADSGIPFIYGTLLAIPVTDAAAGADVAVKIERAFVLPKLTSAVIAGGAKLHWDVSAGQFIVAAPANGDLLNCAVAIAAAGNGTTTVVAKLTPGVGSVQAA
ncbi:hypothetical protein NB688_000577 [Xanthomonas sacchari]|uniref:DUF2190 family protein n=1 Tax=Xanthomonas sacchari TaxID=56458 RepID=A0ABT3DTD3_9XANT|nr:capsid cement protein [Xanthomonas sacchari]MCW0398763.1 hypothetical protein [Xanthomonas sacchari]MCW0418411.1 hypothetical protein [Xanthomonas sacchari]UYK72526.1 DUF2190 family protein [Xanthomonas sacchari]